MEKGAWETSGLGPASPFTVVFIWPQLLTGVLGIKNEIVHVKDLAQGLANNNISHCYSGKETFRGSELDKAWLISFWGSPKIALSNSAFKYPVSVWGQGEINPWSYRKGDQLQGYVGITVPLQGESLVPVSGDFTPIFWGENWGEPKQNHLIAYARENCDIYREIYILINIYIERYISMHILLLHSCDG